MKSRLLALPIALAAISPAAAATYFQGFDNERTEGNVNVSTVNWAAYGTGGAAVSTGYSTTGNTSLSSNVAISNGVGSADPTGYLIDGAQGTVAAPTSNLYIATDAISISVAEVTSYSFSQRHANATTLGYFAIRVDDGLGNANSVKWYRSAGTNHTSSGSTSADWATTTYTSSDTWTEFSFTAGSVLDLNLAGTAAALPTGGTITGVGIAARQTNGNARFDSVSIVPEPSSAGLLGLAGLGLLARRRRR